MSQLTAPARAGGRARAVLIAASLAVFMSSLDLFIVNLAFPYIQREYPGTSIGSLSWVLNAYTIVFAAVLVPAGRWADRAGRRRLFLAGLTAFSAGSLACGLAPGVAFLVGARMVQALGAGMMVPTSLSLVLAAVPPAGRARALGTWSAIGALGAALGPAIGGSLVQASWRWVFWLNIPVGVLAIALSVRMLTESRDENTGSRPDVAGAALLAIGAGLVSLALVKAPSWRWGSAAFTGVLAGGLACGAAMVYRSRRHPAPVLELALLRSPTFSGAFAASFLFYGAFGAFVLGAVEYLTQFWHYSAVHAGLAITPGPLTVLPFARLVAPRMVTLLGGPGRVAAAGCLTCAAGQALWLAQAAAQPAYLTRLLPALLIAGVGVGLTIPSLLGAGSASLPAARFGTGSGILNMARQIGTVLGVSALVAILAAVSRNYPVATWRHALMLTVAFYASAGLVCVAFLTGRPGPASVRPDGHR